MNTPAANQRKHRLPRRKKLAFTLAAFGAALTLLFGYGEFLSRRLAPHVGDGGLEPRDLRLLKYSDDIYLGWELLPNRPELGHNAAGFRGRDYTQSKPQGVWRIAVLGDSVTYGLGVSTQKAFPAVLEGLLNDSTGSEVEVLNFGVPGFNTLQELTLLKSRVLEFDPDVVVMTISTDDAETTPIVIEIDGTYSLFRNQLENTWMSSRLHWAVFKRSAFYRLLYAKLVLTFAVDPEADISDVYLKPDAAWKNIEAASRICEKESLQFLLVLSPLLPPLKGPPKTKAKLAISMKGFETLLNLAKSSTIEHVDLSPLYARHSGELKREEYDFEHLNSRGCRLVGEEISKRLLAIRSDPPK